MIGQVFIDPVGMFDRFSTQDVGDFLNILHDNDIGIAMAVKGRRGQVEAIEGFPKDLLAGFPWHDHLDMGRIEAWHALREKHPGVPCVAIGNTFPYAEVARRAGLVGLDFSPMHMGNRVEYWLDDGQVKINTTESLALSAEFIVRSIEESWLPSLHVITSAHHAGRGNPLWHAGKYGLGEPAHR